MAKVWENRFMKKIFCFISIVSLLISGCQQSSNGGTTTGNPLISFKMTGSSSPATVAFFRPSLLSPWLLELFKPAMALPPPSLQDSSGATVTLNEAWIVVKEVEFKASETVESGEVDGDSVSFQGPYVVDLLAANPDSFGQVRIGSAVLRRVKMKLHNADSLPTTAPTEVLGKSVYWKGAVNGHTFTISSREGYEYELAGPNGIALSDNSNVLASIHIANVFKKMNLSGISTTTDIDESNRFAGSNLCPTIDASASDLYTCFTKGLKNEANLGRDNDGDDELGGGDDSVK